MQNNLNNTSHAVSFQDMTMMQPQTLIISLEASRKFEELTKAMRDEERVKTTPAKILKTLDAYIIKLVELCDDSFVHIPTLFTEINKRDTVEYFNVSLEDEWVSQVGELFNSELERDYLAFAFVIEARFRALEDICKHIEKQLSQNLKTTIAITSVANVVGGDNEQSR